MAGLHRAFVAGFASVLFAGASALSSSASAHVGDPNIDVLIAGLQPANLPGVDVAVVQSIVPALSVLNTSAAELEVLDARGTPFLRVGPRGAEGNAAAAAFYRSAAPGDTAPVPASVPPRGGPARWVLLSRRPAWAWYDDRVPDITTAPSRARSSSVPTRLRSFSIPLRYARHAAAAQGVVTYVPPALRPVARLTSPVHPAAHLTVALLAGSYPDLFLQNDGSDTVTIFGDQGEPFAQVGPHGVRVNLRSPIYAADAVARGESLRTSVNPAATPIWRHVSNRPAYDWLDPRPRFQAHWSVPLVLGAERTSITGTLQAIPAALAGRPPRTGRRDDGLGAPLIVGIALAAVAAIAGVAVAIRRRGAATDRT